MTNKQRIKHYKELFGADYRKRTIRVALEILDNCDVPVVHSADDLAEYADWAVRGICEALESKGFWEDMSGN